MFCWTQSFVVFSFFSRCCHGFVSSLWIIHILSTLLTCNQQTWRLCTTGTEHFYVWLMWLTSNHIRSNWNCNYVTKKTVSSLFCTVLIYFEQVYFQVIVYFVLSEKDTKNCCSSAFNFIWVIITSTVVVRFDLRFSLCLCLHDDILH